MPSVIEVSRALSYLRATRRRHLVRTGRVGAGDSSEQTPIDNPGPISPFLKGVMTSEGVANQNDANATFAAAVASGDPAAIAAAQQAQIEATNNLGAIAATPTSPNVGPSGGGGGGIPGLPPLAAPAPASVTPALGTTAGEPWWKNWKYLLGIAAAGTVVYASTKK